MKNGNIWRGLVCALWALIVFVQYFFRGTHPIFGALHFIPDFFRLPSEASQGNGFHSGEILKSFEVFGAAFSVMVLTWALGRKIRRWVGGIAADPWVLAGLDLGLGLFLLGLWAFGTGANGLWFQSLWKVWLLGLLVWALADLWRSRDFWKNWFRFERPDPLLWPLLGMGLAWTLTSFLQSLLPETFYDSMVYHLAVPNDWILAHGLTDLPGQVFSHFPYGGELFLLNGWILSDSEAAKMLHAGIWFIDALFVGGWAREWGGPTRGWLALGLVSTLPLGVVCAWSTANEGILVLGLLLCVYCTLRYLKEGSSSGRWGLLSGIFAGMSIGVKYNAVVTLAVLLILMTLKGLFDGKKGIWTLGAAWSLGGTLSVLPWFLKNQVFTGNPFFPYFTGLFGNGHLDVPGVARMIREQQGWVIGNLWEAWKLPWSLTMGDPNSYNFIGPLSLALLPLLFVFWPKDRDRSFLGWLWAFSLAAGICLTHILRFSIFSFVFLALLLSGCPIPLEKKNWLGSLAFFAFLTALLASVFLGSIAHFYYQGSGVWTGLETRAEYLSAPNKITPYFALAQEVKDHTPQGARFLLVGDARGLYYDRPFVSNSVFDGQELARLARSEKDAAGMRKRLLEQGIDGLVVNGPEGIRVAADYGHYELTPEEWKRLDDLIQEYTDPVFLQGLQGVYRLLSTPKSRPNPETFDLVLFFSDPASRFVQEVSRGQWSEMKTDLDQSLSLYPFSDFWKEQKRKFERALEPRKGGGT